MPALEPGKIRNVAVVGHRGTGKTSLVEALLYEGGATNRLGSIEQGTTVSDWDEDEQRRATSIGATPDARRLAGPEDQPDRHPRRRQLPGRHDRLADGRRGRADRRQRRHGRRGQHRPRVGPRREARPVARAVREHARPRARGLPARPAPAAGDAVAPLHRGQPPDRRRARADRHRRPAAREGVHEPGGRARSKPVDIPAEHGRSGCAVPDAADRRRRRDGRGADGALPGDGRGAR